METKTRGAAKAAVLTALTAGMILVATRYSRDIRRARTRVAQGGRLINTRCGEVEYAEAGSGPALLAIHGAGGGYDQGLALASAFVASGHRVIAPSRFGYLRTPVPEQASLALQADAHACLLDALSLPQADVIGISAGAPSALEFALRHPERCAHLVLLVPAWASAQPTARPRTSRMRALQGLLGPVRQLLFDIALRSDFLYWATSHLAPGLIEKTVLGTPPTDVARADEAEQARIAEILRDLSPLSQRQEGLSLEGHLIEQTRTQALEEIEVPTLVVSAENDGYGTYENAQRIAARVRRGKFLGYPTGGHLLAGHNPEVMSAITAFLNERSAAPC